MLTGAAERLRQEGLCALHDAARRYGGLIRAEQLEALIVFAAELAAWYAASLAAVTFLIEKPAPDNSLTR